VLEIYAASLNEEATAAAVDALAAAAASNASLKDRQVEEEGLPQFSPKLWRVLRRKKCVNNFSHPSFFMPI
jgi:hypothetical protein